MIDLILSAIQSITQVMVIALAGVIFANKGYIDNDKQKWLSRLNLTFLTPCLLFSNIISVISFENMLELWPIPLFYFIFTFVSWFICKTTLPLFGISQFYKRFITACVMFSNVNSLPIAIVASLAFSEAGKSLFWKVNDTEEMVSARGTSYVLFFGLFCNILRWSLGYSLLQKKDNDNEFDILKDNESDYDYSTSDSRRSSATLSQINQEYVYIKDNTIIDETTKLLSTHPPKINIFKQILVSFDSYMSPPLYAALLAIFVGLCPPLKYYLCNHDAFLYRSITVAIQNCGKASVPLVLFCLGAQLTHIRKHQSSADHNSKGRVPVILTLFLRMVITPIIVIPSMFLFARYGGSELAEDPMFIVSMVIVGCMPTSINLVQITQVSGVFEEEMLNVLFWSYGIMCIPVCTLVIFLALYLVSIV